MLLFTIKILSEIGRFLNADAVIGSVEELLRYNLVAYCKNNPINMSDESGFRPIYTQGEETDAMREASLEKMKFKYGEVDLGKGYNGRVDKPHVKNDQDNVHIYKGNKQVANQNKDGIQHHPNTRVKNKLKEKTGWDWDANEVSESIANGLVIGGGGYIYCIEGLECYLH